MKKTIVIAASPGSASNFLRTSLENTLNCKSNTLKSGPSIGHLILKPNRRRIFSEYFKLNFLFKRERLIYGHIIPTKYNLDILKKYYKIETFIITYRNIYDQLNYLYKWKEKYKKTPLSFPEETYFDQGNPTDNNDIDLALLILLNFYKLWFWSIQKNLIHNFSLISYEDIISKNIQLDFKIKYSQGNNLWKDKKYEPNKRHIEIIDRFISDHKEIDFSKII